MRYLILILLLGGCAHEHGLEPGDPCGDGTCENAPRCATCGKTRQWHPLGSFNELVNYQSCGRHEAACRRTYATQLGEEDAAHDICMECRIQCDLYRQEGRQYPWPTMVEVRDRRTSTRSIGLRGWRWMPCFLLAEDAEASDRKTIEDEQQYRRERRYPLLPEPN